MTTIPAHATPETSSDERMHVLDDEGSCWCVPVTSLIDRVLTITHRIPDTCPESQEGTHCWCGVNCCPDDEHDHYCCHCGKQWATMKTPPHPTNTPPPKTNPPTT